MKIYVEDTVGSKVWARCTVPNPPERYVGGLVVDGVVEGRPMKVTLPPEEMVQEEVVELRDVEDLCDLGHVHEATILEAIERRCAAGRPYVAAGDVVLAVAREQTSRPGQQKRAKFPTSKAPISAGFHSFRLIFGRAIVSRNGLEAWMLFPERARAEHSR